jgi:hypothetical protein
MKNSTDWKGNASLLVGIIGIVASIVVPVWLWKMDLQAKSISIRVLSVARLQPPGSALDNIKVTLDGHEVKDAVLTTIQIVNNGAKPIPASDFESPIRLHVFNGAVVVRAQVTESAPSRLPVVLTTGANSVDIQPLLLNAGDSSKILLITSQGIPGFATSGRIAGVSKIGLEFATLQTMSLPMQLIMALMTLVGIASYIGNAKSLVHGRWINSDTLRILSLVSGASLFTLGTRALQKAYGVYWIPPTWLMVTAVFAGIVAGAVLWKHTVARRRLQKSPSNSQPDILDIAPPLGPLH